VAEFAAADAAAADLVDGVRGELVVEEKVLLFDAAAGTNVMIFKNVLAEKIEKKWAGF
jgi:hypothetical protein